MSSITRAEITDKVLRRLPEPRPDPGDIETVIDDALNLLANREQETARRSAFQTAFSSLPCGAGGVVDLSSTVGILLVDFIDGQSITHSDGTPVDLLPPSAGLMHLALPSSNWTYRAIRQAGNLVVYNGSGTPITTGTLAFQAGYVPTLAQMFNTFDNDLVELVFSLYTGQVREREQPTMPLAGA